MICSYCDMEIGLEDALAEDPSTGEHLHQECFDQLGYGDVYEELDFSGNN